MKMLSISLALFLSSGTNAPHTLTGRWETQPSKNGIVTGVVFKADNSMEGYINRKPFISGRYFFSEADSVLSFADNGCGHTMAVYKVNFFKNSDSLRFASLYDTCTERKAGMQRLVLGRTNMIR